MIGISVEAWSVLASKADLMIPEALTLLIGALAAAGGAPTASLVELHASVVRLPSRRCLPILVGSSPEPERSVRQGLCRTSRVAAS